VSREQYIAVVKGRIRDARVKTGLTLEQAAEALNVSLRYYQRLEGHSQKAKFNPELETLLSLCEVLEVEVSELLKPLTVSELIQSENKVSRKGIPPKLKPSTER
jgi:transcriptional regulator with XRE-family HTH domain